MSIALFKSKHLAARNIAIASIALSGAVHLFIVPEHLSHSAVHASFFAFVGVAQLLWALSFRWRPSAPFYWAGVSVSGGVLITWLLAFLVSTPYSSHVDPIGISLTLSKILEFTGLLALIKHGAARASVTTDRSPRSPTYRLVGRSISAAVIFGAVIWGAGKGAELIFPGSEIGPAHGIAASPGEVHSGDHEGGESHHLEPVPAVSAADPQPTPDIQAIANAAVESALSALELNDSSSHHTRETPGHIPAADDSNFTVDSTRLPASELPSDIEAMIRVAVDSALRQDMMPTPTPALPSDIQAMVAVAVAAALNSGPGLTPEPLPLADHHGPVVAGVEETPGDHQSSQHLESFHVGSPAEDSGTDSLAARPDSVTLPPTPRPLAAATPVPTPAPTAALSARIGLIEPPLSEENQPTLKMVVYGGALVALILIAVVGAVRTWNDIT